MTDEKLCLKWNDFQDLVQASFAELRADTDFTDVTLACEDQNIKTHKVILSACSPFFKKLLKTYPHPQPLIYMRHKGFIGVSASKIYSKKYSKKYSRIICSKKYSKKYFFEQI